jgi:outer membrane protein TolC
MTSNWRRGSLLGGFVVWIGVASYGQAQSDATTTFAELQTEPAVLSLPAALQFALENNPSLAAQRRQHGIAAARLVIADTYPFNPTLETRIQYASGPPEAAVTNKVPIESLMLWEVEVRGQKQIRKEAAAAGFSRVEWEIAFQEQTLAVQVIRAYANLQYRREKLKLLEEQLKLNEGFVEDVRKLVNLGRLRSADLIVPQSEVNVTLDSVNASRESLTAAHQELLRSIGVVKATFEIEGTLEPVVWKWPANALNELAITRRADLRARQMAVAEASANLRLTAANRYGNPIVGPAYTFDPTKIRMIGAQVNVPLPSFNIRRGEVLQSEAELSQAAVQLRQTEIGVKQDVASALARLDAAEARAETLRRKILPGLQQNGEDMRKLFEAGEPGVDVLKVIELRRSILRARDSYLDALWSVRQARADLLAATGEPALELCKPAELPIPEIPPAHMGVPKN